MSKSEADSLEMFDTPTKILIQGFNDNRCAICLDKPVEEGSQCTCILDPSKNGANQVALCSRLEIIPRDYWMQSPENWINLCSRCHQLFIHGYIAFCPPKEVLRYLVKYVKETPVEKQMPLYQVFRELATHNLQGLPDPSAILPYIGLYTIVYWKPEELQDVTISTSFFPPMSIFHNGLWERAPDQTAITIPMVAHIFDPRAVNISRQHPSPGLIPLHSDQPQFSQKRYWRLQNASLGGILSVVVFQAAVHSSLAAELELARDLRRNLTRSRPYVMPSGDGGGSGRGGGRGGKRRQGTLKPAAEEQGNTRATRSRASTRRSITSRG